MLRAVRLWPAVQARRSPGTIGAAWASLCASPGLASSALYQASMAAASRGAGRKQGLVGRGAVMQHETDAGRAELEHGGAFRQLGQETAAAGMALAIEDHAIKASGARQAAGRGEAREVEVALGRRGRRVHAPASARISRA